MMRASHYYSQFYLSSSGCTPEVLLVCSNSVYSTVLFRFKMEGGMTTQTPASRRVAQRH